MLQATSWFQGREQLLRLDIMVGSTGGHETGLEFEVIIVISLSPEQPSLCLPVSKSLTGLNISRTYELNSLLRGKTWSYLETNQIRSDEGKVWQQLCQLV